MVLRQQDIHMLKNKAEHLTHTKTKIILKGILGFLKAKTIIFLGKLQKSLGGLAWYFSW